jgi:hypothetical protein
MTAPVFLAWFAKWKDVLTTIVAIAAIGVVLVQIIQTSGLEKRRLARRRIAAMATLPLPLSAIGAYASSMIRSLAPVQAWLKERDAERPRFLPPPIPTDAIDAIERMIEASPREDISAELARIVADIQVLSSRNAGLVDGDESEFRAHSLSIDYDLILAGEIHARAAKQFDFARSIATLDDPPISAVRSALNLADLRRHQCPSVHDKLDAQETDEGPKPGRLTRIWYAVGAMDERVHRVLWPSP